MAIAADVIADVGADVAADGAADTAADAAADVIADAAADVATDVAADAATDVAGDAVTDAVVDSAEDIAADVTEDAGDAAADESVETLEEGVEETGAPEGPEEDVQNEELEEDEATNEKASSEELPPSKFRTLGVKFLKFLAIAAVTAPVINVILKKTGAIEWIVKKIKGDKSPPGKNDPKLTKAQVLALNETLAKWNNLSSDEKWTNLSNLQANEKFSPHQQYTLLTYLQTQFALIEKKQGKKQVWSFIEKYNLLKKLKTVQASKGVDPMVERYLIVKDAKAGTPPTQILFSVGCEQIVTALAVLYYVNGKWTDPSAPSN